jgi:uncharacterized repeat protein (TIGR01451 family)
MLAILAFVLSSAGVDARGQATSPGLAVRAVAEVQIASIRPGPAAVQLVPANRVVPGDLVLYTLEIRNIGPRSVASPTVTNPIPTYMTYLPESATGPGAEVSYSVDGGRIFDRPENLQVIDGEGHLRPANVSDYTHIQWKLKITLKPKSVAFARFRAVVK